MAVYTPGALSALFNDSKSEVSDAKEKSDDKLVKLFSKTSSNKRSFHNITTDETSDNATAEKLKSKQKKDEVKKKKIKEDNKNEIDTTQFYRFVR